MARWLDPSATLAEFGSEAEERAKRARRANRQRGLSTISTISTISTGAALARRSIHLGYPG